MGHLCLINPPGIKTTSGLQMHTPNPPIGLAYIAAAAQQAGHCVTVIDGTGHALDQIIPMRTRPDILVQGLTVAQIVDRIPADADVVGLGCMFSTLWPISRQILDAIHAARPELTLIAGGEHPSAVPEHVLDTSPVDIVTVGEGEETIVELLSALDNGDDLSTVKGLVCRKGADIVRSEARSRKKNVDDIPLPAWELFPVEDYIERQQMNGIYQGRAMPILGTRGCPFRCTFCSSPAMWTTQYNMRDVGLVCDEIERYMKRYGATDFHFQDLTAITSKKWIVAFCNELIRRDLTITWQLPSGTRSEAIDEEVCSLLSRTGCKNMAYAPESGDAEIRKLIEKRVNIDNMLESIRSAMKNKLSMSCFFVIGFPQDTNATLRETLKLIRKLAWMGVPDVGVAKFVPYPGSALFNKLAAEGRVELTDDFYLSPIDFYGGGGVQVSYCDNLSARQLYGWMIRLYLNFYLLLAIRRPWTVAANVMRVFFSGREETRYAKWFRDIFKTRRRWRQTATKRAPAQQILPAASATVHEECCSETEFVQLSIEGVEEPRASACAEQRGAQVSTS